MRTILDLLGDELIKKLDVKPIQARGLLRLAAKDVYPTKGFERLSIKELTEVIKNGLKSRLERIDAPNNDKIVTEMSNFATRSQSLITLLNT